MSNDLTILPYELENIRNDLKARAVEEFGLADAQFEGSNISQLINLISYAAFMQNTNATFAFNEMFISKAKDRRNVIKHAKQMGYIYKKNISYQYKIKLRVLRSGTVVLNKYQRFKSNGNDYIYLGDNIVDEYGTYAYLKLLSNENNNNLVGGYSTNNLKKNKYIISEDGEVCEVLYKENIENPKLLLNILSGKELPMYSIKSQDILVEELDDNGNPVRQQGWRNFIKVGSIDTFVTDNTKKIFKMQITLDDNKEFPPSLNDNITSFLHISNDKEGNTFYKMDDDTEYIINTINSITLYFENNDIIEINLDDKYNDKILSNIKILEKNIHLTLKDIPINDVYRDNDLNEITGSSAIRINKLKHTPKEGSYSGVTVSYGSFTKELSEQEAPINGSGAIIVPEIVKKYEIVKNLEIKDDDIIIPDRYNIVTNISLLSVIDDNGNKTIIDEEYYDYKNNIITLDTTSLNRPEYNNGKYSVEITIDYVIPLKKSIIKAHYIYSIESLSNIKVKLDYNYIMDNRGYLARRFYFSDFKGEIKANQKEYSKNNPNGWNGFYANSFNPETNILTFPIGKIDGDLSEYPETLNSHYHNCYVEIDGKRKGLHNIMTTPFKRTRFSFTEPIIDPISLQITGFKKYDENTTFCSITGTMVKNELDIIVKEGLMRRWIEETESSIESRKNAIKNNIKMPIPIYKNPDLQIEVRPEMVKEGYFSIHESNIEDDGIEMFISRTLPSGIVEQDYRWTKRKELLTENIGDDDHTFITMADDNYEDYLNIFTKYAGTGTPLSLGMKIKINVLTSKGSKGFTNTLIEPMDSEDFEAIYYIQESMIPNILHIEGSDAESTESIRKNAVLFSNTANRAVTKNDYKTICESQGYISVAQIWGGEEEVPKEIPGHIIFSFIPTSRPINFLNTAEGNYILKDITQNDLFYPTYYEITGREGYFKQRNDKDIRVLFNILNNYKIITLKFDYEKSIYMDFDIYIKVFKYRFGQTIVETNKNIFNAARDFFIRNIEKYDSKFFYSSLLRYVDQELGDDFGLEMTTRYSVELSDSLYEPHKGSFMNASNKDLSAGDNMTGLIGDNDLWKFKMPIGLPEIDLFESNEVLDGVIIRKGRLLEYKLTTCNTKDFLIPGDYLYMEMTPTAILSLDIDGNPEKYPNIYSETIEISIMYTKNYKSFKNGESEVFKIGSYTIYKNKDIAVLEFFTHAYWNIESQAIVDEKLLAKKDKYKNYDDDLGGYIYQSEDLGKPIYYKVDENGDLMYLPNGEKIETMREKNTPISKYSNIPKPYTDDFEVYEFFDEDKLLYRYKKGVLPRYYFIEKPKRIIFNGYEKNIKNIKNVFGRLRTVNFL